MNKLLGTLFILLPLVTVAQKNKDTSVAQHQHVFQQAIQYNDINVAINALYQIMAIEPESAYKDTLAYLYFDSGKFLNAYLVGQEILKKNPNNAKVMELVAECEEYMGMTKEALAKFEVLAPQSKQAYHFYKVATLQYQMQRYSECIATITSLIALPDAAQKSISIAYEENKTQPIQINAAAYNILGMIYLNTDKLNEAKQAFDKALSINGNFVLAKNNVQFLEDILQKKSKSK